MKAAWLAEAARRSAQAVVEAARLVAGPRGGEVSANAEVVMPEEQLGKRRVVSIARQAAKDAAKVALEKALAIMAAASAEEAAAAAAAAAAVPLGARHWRRMT
jgi:hypothetical protein